MDEAPTVRHSTEYVWGGGAPVFPANAGKAIGSARALRHLPRCMTWCVTCISHLYAGLCPSGILAAIVIENAPCLGSAILTVCEVCLAVWQSQL
jgi:hypothetical protein